ncbi:MAG: hypothetical protein WC058_12765 [Phycisphaeraceae bacterium]
MISLRNIIWLYFGFVAAAAMAVRVLETTVQNLRGGLVLVTVFSLSVLCVSAFLFIRAIQVIPQDGRNGEISRVRLVLVLANAIAGGIALGRIALNPPVMMWNIEGIVTGAIIVGACTWIVLMVCEGFIHPMKSKKANSNPKHITDHSSSK